MSSACQMNIPVALTKRERSPLIVPGVDDSKCSTTHSHSYGCVRVCIRTRKKPLSDGLSSINVCRLSVKEFWNLIFVFYSTF